MTDGPLSSLGDSIVQHSLLAWPLFGMTLLLAWRPWARADLPATRGTYGFIAVLLLALIAFRWPILFIPDTLNIDESQMVAGAFTLRHDPVFWRAIEGQTIGPLDYYAVMGPSWLSGHRFFLGARALALFLAGSVIGLTFVSARRVFSERAARWGAMLLLTFFALTTDFDFVHYSSEHVPICLVALAIACLLYVETGGTTRWLLVAGLAVGAVPFAKMQAGPIAAWLFVSGVAYCLLAARVRALRQKALIMFVAGTLAMPLFVALLATVFGVWRDLWISYFEANLFYAGNEESSRLSSWHRLASLIVHSRFLGPLLAAALLSALIGRVTGGRATASVRWYLVFGVGSFVAAALGISIARRAFEHYLLLLTPSLGLMAAYGAAMLEAQLSRWGVAGALALVGLGVGLPVLNRVTHENPTLLAYQQGKDFPEGTPSPVVDELKRWVKPGDTLAVWGWEPSLYVRTQCRQATPDPSTRREIEPSPRMDYYRARYLAALRASNPRVLIDTTAAHRRGYGFESFTEFSKYLEAHYRLHTTIENRRIYVRRD